MGGGLSASEGAARGWSIDVDAAAGFRGTECGVDGRADVATGLGVDDGGGVAASLSVGKALYTLLDR